jgi:hypothetical protein
MGKYLIEAVIGEYEAPHTDSVIRLYAALLLRQVASTDEILLREYGKRIADLSPKPIPCTQNSMEHREIR